MINVNAHCSHHMAIFGLKPQKDQFCMILLGITERKLDVTQSFGELTNCPCSMSLHWWGVINARKIQRIL